MTVISPGCRQAERLPPGVGYVAGGHVELGSRFVELGAQVGETFGAPGSRPVSTSRRTPAPDHYG
jgi:hypothetical protein